VAGQEGRDQVGEVAHRRERPLDRFALEGQVGVRLAGEHLLPGRHLVAQVVEHEARCFRAVALASGVCLADDDLELGGAVAVVDVRERGITDRSPAIG
jgi:hypothetical protein